MKSHKILLMFFNRVIKTTVGDMFERSVDKALGTQVVSWNAGNSNNNNDLQISSYWRANNSCAQTNQKGFGGNKKMVIF